VRINVSFILVFQFFKASLVIDYNKVSITLKATNCMRDFQNNNVHVGNTFIQGYFFFRKVLERKE
jgi:hypothetical protein